MSSENKSINLNVLGMSEQSLLIIIIIIVIIQSISMISYSEGISAYKQRFASVRSGIAEGYGLSGADYNGGHLNFNASKGEGGVIKVSRDIDNIEGLASVVESENKEKYTEGLDLVDYKY